MFSSILIRNLATVFEVWFCGGKEQSAARILDDREVQRQIYFGYVEVAGKEAPKSAPSHDQPARRHRHVLETGHGYRDSGFISFGLLLELCRTHPACG